MERVGVLTGGGDCPGLNAVIRGIVRKAIQSDIKIIGIKNGWKGMVETDYMDLDLTAIAGILPKGGTILGTSRTNPYNNPGDVRKVIDTYKKLQLDALIAIGGEDTLGVANKLNKENKGLHLVGVPKTIDNDLNGTDYTFGFDTAVNVAMEAIDRLHTTAESHHRIMVVEVMGRHAGWIAIHSGLAAGADVILIPEVKIDLDEVCALLQKRHSRGKQFSIVVVAEGAEFKAGQVVTKEAQLDSFGHVRLGGIGEILACEIEKRVKFETRVTVLGHIQRGGSPTAFDRVLGTRFGVKAMELVLENKFGHMTSLSGVEIKDVSIADAVGTLKTVGPEFYEMAKTFFG
ncbi:MAG: 6-phosphofructokinase [Candidatus Omnitrophota bacterium]|nr:6-phosphofructokinase [Candidatus Omnitrophota bacterium]